MKEVHMKDEKGRWRMQGDSGKQFYFKQFNLAWLHSLIIKNNSISSYSV